MNPPNPFGSSQSGAFQAPSSAVKPSPFPPIFGQQQSSTNPNQQTTTSAFFGTGFGQSSSSVFGSAHAFSRPPAAPSAPQQAPAFGQQPQQQQQSHVFGHGAAAPAFGQTSTSQGSVFGEAPSFGATFGSSGFGQGFGSQSSGFGTQQQQSAAPQFGQTSGFAQQPVFGQNTSTTSSSGIFGSSSSNVTQSRGFGSSEFSFKPSNEALFKPIISASPEPTTTTTVSTSAFGSTPSASSGLFSSSKPTTGGFSFSQPAALPAAQQPLTSGTNTAPQSSGLHFTFSQPASPQSNKSVTNVNQPTTPSSFSFTSKTLQTQTPFGQSKFGQAFGDVKEKESEEKDGKAEPTAETNVFSRLSKIPEAAAGTSSSGEKEVSKDFPEEGLDRQLKRPLARTRGPPPGLFGRALSGLRRDASGAPKREAKQAAWEEPEGLEPGRKMERTETPPVTTTAESREQEKNQEMNKDRAAPSSSSAALQTPPPPARPVSRRDSSDPDSSVLQCRNIPPELNHKTILGKHFGAFGKILRIYCKPQKDVAFISFQDHASAVKAKKNGKMINNHEVLLLMQRKKQSPGDKGSSRLHHHQKPLQSFQDEAKPEQIQVQVQSPVKRPTLRPATLSTSVTFSSPMKKSRPLEPQTESSSDPQTSDRLVDRPVERPIPTSVPSSLLPLIGQTAETVEEKYQLLEQRDKILRQGRPKRTDLHLSSVFVGTCPDMCPEKERYMRETRKQLSVYEVLPNTEMVDHSAAIKEYSRSSADQEEPLPHELRPLPVLSRTMDYLVTQILDQGQDNYRDWYDFVWNRTRGIRKDITQQHLCCPETVALIEKCTRFHVHCAHELCEEHMSSFDAKINNENMTKCLQSLKEMYQDLSMVGVYCPLEAEIRQYNVLLKLNDGDIQREVQQFRDSVRNSPEVTFAVQAAQAVNNNNFVRFFKLVKSASYLPACLLHRYFNQVRSRALKTLSVAYTVGPRSTFFPLDDIVRMLMFPNGDVASAFIQQHGLNVSDGLVELNRTSFQDPELPVSPRRSEVIRSKRRVLIGEVVNGGALPNPPEHRPVCSFDHNSKYRGDQLSTEPPPPPYRAPVSFRPPPPEPQPVSVHTQEKPSVFVTSVTLVHPAPPQPVSQPAPPQFVPPAAPLQSTPEPVPLQAGPEDTREPSLFVPAPERHFQPIPQPEPPVPVKVPTPPPPKPVYSQEDIEAELNSVVEEVTDVAVREVAEAAFCYTSAALEVSRDQVEALVCEVTENLLKDISSDEIKLEEERIAEEKRRIEEARRKREHEEFLIEYSFSLCSELVYEVLDETIEETAASEIQEAVDEKAALVSRCTEEVCTALIEETADIDIAALVEEVLDVELQRIHKYIKRWREVVTVRRQLKRQMRAFPAAPCFVDPRCKLKALAPSAENNRELLSQGLVNLGHAGTLSVSTTRSLKLREEVIHKLRVQYFYQLLLEESSWSPLDIPALATKHFPNPPPAIFWKFLLLLPSEHETAASECDRVLCDWLSVKLGSVSPLPPEGFLHTLCQSSSVQETPHGTHTVHIAIKVSSGPLSPDGLSKIEECCDLQGSSALLMLLPLSLLLDQDQDEALLSALLQLKQLQQTSSWSCPLPLVLLVPGMRRSEEQKETLAEALMLPRLVEDGLISEFSFFFIPETTSDLQGSRQLSSSLSWLLSRAPPSSPLSCQTLVEFVESGLSREVSSRVLLHRRERSSSSLPPQRPLPVIRLYNAALKHLAECASSSELGQLSWPPPEFCTEENARFVPRPGWNCPEHLSWIKERILSLQLPLWDDQAPTGSWSDLCSSIVSFAARLPSSPRSQPLLMSRLENLLERLRFRAQSGAGAQAWTVPWDDVLELCIDHKLKDWSVQEELPCEDSVTEDGQILVYFFPDSLRSFCAPEEWTEALKETHREKHEAQDTGATAAAWAPDVTSSLQKRLFFRSQTRERPPQSVLDVSYTPTPEEATLHRFQQQLEEEKQKSKKMLEKFQLWSEGEALVQLQFPMFLPSSTLLTTPTLLPPTGLSHTQGHVTAAAAASAQVYDESSESPRRRRASLPWRLEDVERELRAGREAERVCKLQLSFLQNIVND